jgi:hypothetical protein
MKQGHPRIARPHQGREWDRANAILLDDIPDAILASYAIANHGLSEGLALCVGHWRQRLLAGVLPAHQMRASTIPVAALASAMVEALLRGTPIDQRQGAFDLLCEESHRVLSGRPQAVILQSGIL